MVVPIKTFYLIDYENVNSDGLEGCDKLGNSDQIVIFFTQNAKRIDMSEIANHGAADLDMVEVPAGKQSTDIHISSYLGYLAGIHADSKCSIVIVSKDSDYDNVIKFWKNKTGLNISRKEQIKKTVQKQVVKQSVAPSKNSPKVSGNKKSKLNQEAMQAVRNAGFDASIANAVAQISTGLCGSKNFLNDVHNALMDKYSNYKDVYKAVKPVLSKYSDAESVSNKSNPVTSQNKTSVNSEIMKTLSAAGYTNETSSYVASTVVKNLGVKNGKQQTYRTIISKYGQDKGLVIYNHIKKHI